MFLVKEQIETISQYFENKNIINVYVFGSYARGDAEMQSDLDLILEFDCIKIKEINIKKFKSQLTRLLSLNCDIYDKNKILKYARGNIFKEMVLICSYLK